MPLYDFKCPACGHTHEKLVKSGGDVPPPCPKCERPTERQVSAPGHYDLQGGGWYATDFKHK